MEEQCTYMMCILHHDEKRTIYFSQQYTYSTHIDYHDVNVNDHITSQFNSYRH